MDEPKQSAFEQAAADVGSPSLLSDFWFFLKHNKKWWLLPLIAVLLLFGLLMMLSGSALAPFIYPLF